jgi:hypothetical protein
VSRKIITDPKKLQAEYESGLSCSELAKQYDTSTTVIVGALRRFGVPLRDLSDAAKLKLKKYGHPSLGRTHTPEARKKMSERHANFKGANHPQFKGAGKYSEDGAYLSRDAKGYYRRTVPSHPLSDTTSGYIGEHVYQACMIWGWENVKGYDIHHKNEDKGDNRWDNLERKTRSDHIRDHNLIRWNEEKRK